MPQYDITYAFNPSAGSLAFENKEPLNQLLVEKASNRLSPLASAFNVFGYMSITNNGKFKVKTLRALPLGLRACVPCSWDPISSRVVRTLEIEPCCLEADEEFCPQEELNEILTGIIDLEANADGSVNTAKEAEFVQLLADLWADGISQAYNGILAAGKIYDGASAGWAAGVSTTDQTNFPKTANACKGYVRLFKDLSATYAWLNKTGIYVTTTGSETVSQAEFIGNPVDAIESLKASAKPELLTAINQGFYMTSSGTQLRPFILCDIAFYNRVVDYYKQTIGVMPVMESSPIKVETMAGEFQGMNGRKFTSSIPVYTIYGLPVIYDPNINTFDTFKKAHMHFVCITVGNNIQLGTSLAAKDVQGVAQPPIKFQKSPLLKDKNKVFMTTSVFAASALASENYAVASQLLVTWS